MPSHLLVLVHSLAIDISIGTTTGMTRGNIDSVIVTGANRTRRRITTANDQEARHDQGDRYHPCDSLCTCALHDRLLLRLLQLVSTLLVQLSYRKGLAQFVALNGTMRTVRRITSYSDTLKWLFRDESRTLRDSGPKQSSGSHT